MGSATVVLRRTGGWWYAGRKYEDWEVFLDGKVAGSIANGAHVELLVEPGPHTLRLRSPRWKRRLSKERSFTVAEGQVVSFSAHEPRFWPMALAALVKPDLWITLKQH